MKKKEPLWKHEERALRKVKSRKWRKKSKKILTVYEHQKSRAEFIGNEVRKNEYKT